MPDGGAGEDPVLTAQYAVNYVQGMQQIKVGKGGKPVLKMLSSLKHYTVRPTSTFSLATHFLIQI